MVPKSHRHDSSGAAIALLREREVNAAKPPTRQRDAGADEAIAARARPSPGPVRSDLPGGLGVHSADQTLAYSVDDAISYAPRYGRIEATCAAHGLSFQPPER